MRTRVFLGLVQGVALWASLAAQPGLKIVVIEGEGAVNIIQQKTAVAPVVEVRDRNDQPVAGALVSFTINGGRNARFAGGLRSVTLTTNAAGRAAATTATPTGSGAVQINVAATFQGQTATATITQSNVATAAQASAASNASGGSASGGGLSTGTLTAIGAAAAGGLIATRRLTGATNQAPYLCGSSSGSLSSPTGSGAVNGSVQAGSNTLGSVSSGGVLYASQSDATVLLAVTSVTGTGVVAGTFTGRQAPGLNSFTGTFSSAAATRTATITRQ